MKKAKQMKKRDPESTLSGRLKLMTEDRDHFQFACQELQGEQRKLQGALEAKEARFVSYKRKVDDMLRWHRQVIQELLTKIPGGVR